jgi:hypothetical protein
LGEIDRVATGIYFRPKISKTVGKISPTIEEIAQAIVKRDKAKIVPMYITIQNCPISFVNIH